MPTKDELIEEAEELGIDVKSSWTKSEVQDAILDAIQEVDTSPDDDFEDEPEFEDIEAIPEVAPLDEEEEASSCDRGCGVAILVDDADGKANSVSFCSICLPDHLRERVRRG